MLRPVPPSTIARVAGVEKFGGPSSVTGEIEELRDTREAVPRTRCDVTRRARSSAHDAVEEPKLEQAHAGLKRELKRARDDEAFSPADLAEVRQREGLPSHIRDRQVRQVYESKIDFLTLVIEADLAGRYLRRTLAALDAQAIIAAASRDLAPWRDLPEGDHPLDTKELRETLTAVLRRVGKRVDTPDEAATLLALRGLEIVARAVSNAHAHKRSDLGCLEDSLKHEDAGGIRLTLDGIGFKPLGPDATTFSETERADLIARARVCVGVLPAELASLDKALAGIREAQQKLLERIPELAAYVAGKPRFDGAMYGLFGAVESRVPSCCESACSSCTYLRGIARPRVQEAGMNAAPVVSAGDSCLAYYRTVAELASLLPPEAFTVPRTPSDFRRVLARVG